MSTQSTRNCGYLSLEAAKRAALRALAPPAHASVPYLCNKRANSTARETSQRLPSVATLGR